MSLRKQIEESRSPSGLYWANATIQNKGKMVGVEIPDIEKALEENASCILHFPGQLDAEFQPNPKKDGWYYKTEFIELLTFHRYDYGKAKN